MKLELPGRKFVNAQVKEKNLNPRWAGETVVCVASGPSLTQEDVAVVQAQHVASRCKVIVVNREFESAPWADVLYAADDSFWKEYIVDVREVFKGELWTQDFQASKRLKLNLIERASGDGYSSKPHSLTTGGNSGFQAVHLAAYWGAGRILLLGYDMQRTNGREHHYGKHRGKLPNGKGFNVWIPKFKPLVIDLNRMGVSLINLTRETAIPEDWITRSTVEEVVW